MVFIPRIIYEFWHKNKTWICILLIVVTVVVMILLLTYIGHAATNNERKSLKCKMCGKGFKWNTWLGDLYGNHCHNGSFGDTTEDCGMDSACFKMNSMVSDKMKENFKKWTDWFKNVSHHWEDHFLYNDGTIRGCIKGFGWLDNCHFFNTSNIWKHETYWHATNLCVCTTDNCN